MQNQKLNIFHCRKYFLKQHNSFIKIFWMMYILFPFRFKGFEIIQTIIYYGISLICVGSLVIKYQNQAHDKHVIKCFIGYIGVLLVLTIMVCIIPFVYNTHDMSYLSYYLYNWGRIVILCGSFIFCHSFYECIDLIIYAISLYVIFSIILLVPPIHLLYMKIISNPTINSDRVFDLYSKTYYTRFGLQGFSGFGATFRCSEAVLLCCYMLSIVIQSKKLSRKYLICLMINIIGNCFYGRVGVIASLILVLCTITYLTVKYKKYKIFMGAIIISVLIIYFFLVHIDRLKQINSFYWIFEGFINYLERGKFETSSSIHLREMYIKPSFNTIIWGDGYYTQKGMYYMHTDVGFLRPLFFGGIMMVLLYYGLLIPLLYVLGKKLRCNNGNFFILISLMLISIFELKGEELLEFTNTLFVLAGSLLLKKSTYCLQINLNYRDIGNNYE